MSLTSVGMSSHRLVWTPVSDRSVLKPAFAPPRRNPVVAGRPGAVTMAFTSRSARVVSGGSEQVRKIRVVRGDITAIEVDAIVNAANSSLMGGGGVDGAIHRAGGPEILEECRAIVARQGGCPPGEAVVTTGGRLPARYVIHTVGPIWSDGSDAVADQHDRTLASAYRRSLEMAAEIGARTVAFPNISTGIYGFPRARAAPIAVTTVRDFLADNEGIDEVMFVCFDSENLELYQELLADGGHG